MAGSVSMWGPNAQGVRSRPDRSVSLRPQQMGGVFHWGGYGNPPALWQTGLDGRGVWGNASDFEGRRFLEAAAEQARREGKDVPPDPEAGSAEEGNWVTKIYDYLGRTQRYMMCLNLRTRTLLGFPPILCLSRCLSLMVAGLGFRGCRLPMTWVAHCRRLRSV